MTSESIKDFVLEQARGYVLKLLLSTWDA
jgi:hypothetical protein